MGRWDRDGTAMLRPASHGGVAQSLSRAERGTVPGNSGDRVAIDGARHALRPVPRSRLHGQAHHRAGARWRPRARNARPFGGHLRNRAQGRFQAGRKAGRVPAKSGSSPKAETFRAALPPSGQDRTATSSAPRKTSPGHFTITGKPSRAIAESTSGTEREHFCCTSHQDCIRSPCRTGGAALHDVTPLDPGRRPGGSLHHI